MKRKILWILALFLLCAAVLFQRQGPPSIDVRGAVCTALLPDGAPARVIAAPYRCGDAAPRNGDGWLWLRLDAGGVRDLPPGWQLLVDQTRFAELAIVVERADGATRTTWAADALGDNWAPGGMLRFAIPAAGRDVRGLYLGFREIDDLSLMRKVRAASPAAQFDADSRWLLLMGVFAGTLLSAFLYNLVIHTGARYAFQRWYLLWVAVAFAYGMVWTNMAAFVVPGLVGPLAVRLDFVLVGLLVAAGNLFFYSVIERGVLPPWLLRGGRALAVLGAVLGVAAASDGVFPPVAADRWLNYVIAATAVSVAGACAVAVRRGSRVVWFYMLGWGPVICVFVARLFRNLGLAPQSDLIDMATFAALAFEALVLSLAIADRFRLVRRELEITRQRRAVDLAESRTLRLAAQTDFLTGLGNRAAFQEGVQALADHGAPFTLYLVDVDYLKEINDRLGHAGGDALLKAVAGALAVLREAMPDLRVARIGGDEFAILCPGTAAAQAPIEQRLDAMQGMAWSTTGDARPLSLSIGHASFPADAPDVDHLYQNADLALYSAKRLGRGRLYRYDPLQRILRDLRIGFVRDAEGALQRGEFCLHFQPIVTLPSGGICGHEALLRWNHPEHGLMMPDRFAEVLVAEKIGLRIQEHVLELALGALQADVAGIGTLSVNFTAAQLAGPLAAERVLARLAHYGLPPDALCVEVTESVMLDRAAETVRATLQTLHDAGVCIALDDFGTGFASLVHLRQLPVDRIKIDQSFVAGMDGNGGGTIEIVRAIVGLGSGLGKIVVAEGVETEAQARTLVALGCDLAQGYLYGRPVPR